MVRPRGFTLIELLVVVSIISLLASVVLASVSEARERSKISAAKAQIRQIERAMLLYLDQNGTLPGQYSMGTSPCNSDWTGAVDLLVASGFLKGRADTDPWGNYYCYDGNYLDTRPNLKSPLVSSGPNGVRETLYYAHAPSGDDFGVFLPGTDGI